MKRPSPEQQTDAQPRSTCRWGQMLWCSLLRRRHWTSLRILAIAPWLRRRPAQRLSARERCPGLQANLVPALPLTGISLRSSLASCMEWCDSCPCSSRLPEKRTVSCNGKMSIAMMNAQPWRGNLAQVCEESDHDRVCCRGKEYRTSARPGMPKIATDMTTISETEALCARVAANESASTSQPGALLKIF